MISKARKNYGVRGERAEKEKEKRENKEGKKRLAKRVREYGREVDEMEC